jgi:radical SAM superfamily enzyme YgiQ (UPF0313 family)
MKKEMDFILINPPSPPGKVSNKDMMGGFGQNYSLSKGPITKIPSIDLAYICSESEREGLNFFVIDSLAEDLIHKNVLERIEKEEARYIFIKTSTPSFWYDSILAKEINKISKAQVFLFGPHVQQKKEESLGAEGVKGIILGEPEEIIPKIAKKGYKQTNGLWFKENGKILKKKIEPLISDIDSLGFPLWEFFPYHEYSLGEQINNKKPFVTMLTSRGCPYQCMYCPYPIGQGAKWRARSSQNVLEELEKLHNFYNVKGVLFRDAVFTLDRERTKKICEGLIERKINISWRCETRIDRLDLELVKLMKKAGCIGINIGIESLSKDVLDFLGSRPPEIKRIYDIADFCNKNGIDLFLFFIIGLPKETKKSILKTVSWVRKLNIPYAQFTIATPYPGTRLEEWAKKEGYLLSKEYNDATGYSCLMKNEFIGPKTIGLLYKYSNLSSQLGNKNILKRIKKRGSLQVIKEVAKVLLAANYFIQIKLTSEKK